MPQSLQTTGGRAAPTDPIYDVTIQEDPGNFIERTEESVVDLVDRFSRTGSALRETADNFEQALLDSVNRVKKDSEKKIKDNLIQGRAESYGAKVGNWLSKGNNILWAAGGLLLIIYLFRR